MSDPIYVCISGVPRCGWAFWQTFDCPLCDRTICYCNGCADEMPALCDDCWAKVSGSPDANEHETAGELAESA